MTINAQLLKNIQIGDELRFTFTTDERVFRIRVTAFNFRVVDGVDGVAVIDGVNTAGTFRRFDLQARNLESLEWVKRAPITHACECVGFCELSEYKGAEPLE